MNDTKLRASSGTLVTYSTTKPAKKSSKKARISSSKDAYHQALKYFEADAYEENFSVLYLNSKNEVIETATVAIGSVKETHVSPPAVIRPAIITQGCSRMILVHNHPSGDSTPSPEDASLTSRLVECAQLFNFEILDHIVLGSGSYSSLRDMGIIKQS